MVVQQNRSSWGGERGASSSSIVDYELAGGGCFRNSHNLVRALVMIQLPPAVSRILLCISHTKDRNTACCPISLLTSRGEGQRTQSINLQVRHKIHLPNDRTFQVCCNTPAIEAKRRQVHLHVQTMLVMHASCAGNSDSPKDASKRRTTKQ